MSQGMPSAAWLRYHFAKTPRIVRTSLFFGSSPLSFCMSLPRELNRLTEGATALFSLPSLPRLLTTPPQNGDEHLPCWPVRGTHRRHDLHQRQRWPIPLQGRRQPSPLRRQKPRRRSHHSSRRGGCRSRGCPSEAPDMAAIIAFRPRGGCPGRSGSGSGSGSLRVDAPEGARLSVGVPAESVGRHRIGFCASSGRCSDGVGDGHRGGYDGGAVGAIAADPPPQHEGEVPWCYH